MELRLKKQIEFLLEIDKMKSVFRQNLLIDKSRQENDAEHSWHFAMFAIILYEYVDSSKIDLLRVLKMALVHDLVEIYAGDTYAYDDIGNKDSYEREQKAADKLFALLPEDQAKEIRDLWEEFDKRETEDAKYASAIDCLQPFLCNHHLQGEMWKANKVTSRQVYKRQERIKNSIPELWSLVDDLIKDAVEKGYLAE